MGAFTTKVDIANRAIQKVGAARITSFSGVSKEAEEVAACYDMLRRAELRRNTWCFSIRRAVLRPLGTALPAWDATVTYAVGSLVTYNSVNYVSIQAANLNQQPNTQITFWSIYTGVTSQKVTFNAWANGTTYTGGDIVTGTDSLIYLSMASGNLAHDPTTDDGTYWQLYCGNYIATAWDSGVTYSTGELVFDTAQNAYYSTTDNNAHVPSSAIGWTQLSCVLSAIMMIPWPAGAGPRTDNSSRNVFVNPYGFLRETPLDPRAGDYSTLGYPSNLIKNDWVREGDFIVSRDTGPIVLRFAADIAQVTLMDDMFCEGLACRIAYEVCETLTQSNTKLQAIGGQYKNFMGEARTVNAIEVGSTQPTLDDYIATRI